MREVDSEESLLYWATKARKGESAIYYDGFLMMDRERYFTSGGDPQKQPDNLRAAKFAWHLCTDGVVNLVQRKKGNFSYEYIAVKR